MRLYTSKVIADWLGLTERRVRQLRDEGIIEEQAARIRELEERLEKRPARPQVSYDDLRPFDPGAPTLDKAVREQVEITVKYEGYIRRQQRQVEEFEQLEKHALPDDMDYSDIQGLRLEAREKLSAVRPLNLGQASRISGVSPADIGALMIWLQSRRG